MILDLRRLMERIGDGAEAVIYRDGDTAVKERIRKGYRIIEIDERLRKFRTRREAKLIEKVGKLGFGPRFIDSDEKNMKIRMGFIDGRKVRDIIDQNNLKRLCQEIGKGVAELHNNKIIHSDLTTSNMIFKDKIYFIDFGLSFESAKVEDKAVDLHLLRQALESKHHELYEQAFKEVMDSYMQHAKDAAEVQERFSVVEKRGRYKSKGS
jgi:TP53 regulating kinase-like protein